MQQVGHLPVFSPPAGRVAAIISHSCEYIQKLPLSSGDRQEAPKGNTALFETLRGCILFGGA
jgi:hypothetical protein